MNFLFHMLLSGDDEHLLVGNFMGDFVKGRLEGRFAPRIRQGVMLHRRIDSFADRHSIYRQSRQRLAAQYGLYRGVMVDLFYDHLLMNSWQKWSPEPFDAFLLRSRGIIECHHHALPEEMQPLVRVIFDELLPSYGSVKGIGSAFRRMSRRLSRPNPLSGCEVELCRQFDGLQQDFMELTPALFSFALEQSRMLALAT